MRVAPVSGDLLVKLALGLLLVGGAVYAVRRAGQAASSAWSGIVPSWDTAASAAYSIAPWNQENVIYQTVNGGVSNAVGYTETLGGWLYDVTHRDPMAAPPPAGYIPFGAYGDPTPAFQGNGATGSW